MAALVACGWAEVCPVRGQTANNFSANANGSVYALAEQIDAEIPIGGTFTTVDGQSRKSLGRVNSEGAVDFLNQSVGLSFGVQVSCLSILPDGKLLVGGSFQTFGNKYRTGSGRLNADGSLDNAFNGLQGGYSLGVMSMGVQPDGKVIAAGGVKFTAEVTYTNIARFNPDGTFDTNFPATVDGNIRSMVFQPDGNIILAGDFSTVNGQPCSRLARLRPDGTLDSLFNAGTNSSTIYCLAVQADGKILVGGSFTNLSGQPRNRLGRLNSDGSLDPTFNPGVTGRSSTSTALFSFGLQADGKIIVGGIFTKIDGVSRTNLARLNADGSIDTNFNALISPTNSAVYGLGIQSDGKILVGGYFTNLAGEASPCLAQLENTDPMSQSLGFDGSTITWLRGGTAPELWSASFEASTNGIDWTGLGFGTRIAGGWQLSGVSVPTNAIIRARGFVNGGYANGSTWFVQSWWPGPPTAPPDIVINDASFGLHSNAYGFHFTASAEQATVVETSTNLLDWSGLSTNAPGSSLLDFNDPQATNRAVGFYRLRVQ